MIPFCSPNITSKEKEYVAKAIDSGWVGSKGEFIDKFEEALAKYIGMRYCITTSSGTSALFLAYLACGMKPSSKVITTHQTFAATYHMAQVISQDVKLIKPDIATWNLNPVPIDNCDFFIAVHIYGNPCHMGQLYRTKYVCIEDVAQGLGSKFKGRMLGSFGHVSCFSFHSAKTITCGEGGACLTNDKVIADRIRHLRGHCMTKPYVHDNIGWNHRMTHLQAALGLAQLERIDELLDKKCAITKFYNENLSKAFTRQQDARSSKVVHWANAYSVSGSSEPIKNALFQSNIETRPGFNRDDIIVLPCGTLLTKPELESIVKTANEAAT